MINLRKMFKNENYRPIFIIARFRSGSTMLWKLFSIVEEYAAYFEPLHESVDGYMYQLQHDEKLGHKNVIENPFGLFLLNWEKIGKSYKREVAFKNIILEKDEKYPVLERWISTLLTTAKSSEKVAVFQFNRADFRIMWLKKNFPTARFIYLYRNPRNQYVSFFTSAEMKTPDWLSRFTPTQWLTEPYMAFINPGWHLFYLKHWRILLSEAFPFLITYPFKNSYEISYCIWRLSYLAGTRNADLILNLEEDFFVNPTKGIKKLIDQGLLPFGYREKALSIVSPGQIDKYKSFTREDFFIKSEERSQKLLQELGLEQWFGIKPLRWIKRKYKDKWKQYEATPKDYIQFFESYFTIETEKYIDGLIAHFLRERKEKRSNHRKATFSSE